MNIFILDYDIKTNAYFHCDQHVNKMILESAQMICTVAGECGMQVPYKPTHANHPCTKWVRESVSNYIYVLDLMYWLNKASKERYNRKSDHKSYEAIMDVEFPDSLPDKERTNFARAMPDQYKSIPDVVDAYRAYYHTKEFATWKNGKPFWFNK